MINLWYDSDEVNGFHPIVETALHNAIANCGYGAVLELVHHPAIPNSTTIPDFAIKLKTSNRYVFVLEVKKTPRDVTSQRFQNQTRSYVSDFSPYWEPNYPKYFCLTNIEELILFADRLGPIATCILKNNPKSHTPFDPQTRDITATVAEFQATLEEILPLIYTRAQPQWENNWQPIIDAFYQNYKSVSNHLPFSQDLSEELSLYEFFRLLAFAYIKDYYHQTGNDNQRFFKRFPSDTEALQAFKTKLSNNYDQVLQLDFKQVFSNHPNAANRIFPENVDASILHYFKNFIQTLSTYSDQAVSDHAQPEYIFNLLTSKVYDKPTLHKKGKIMSDTELSILLATVTIDHEDSTVLDPCSGDGALLDAAYDYLNLLHLSTGILKDHNVLLHQVSGIEIDPFLAQLATFRLVSKNLSGVDHNTITHILTGNTFSNLQQNTYDVILMNPPFLRNDNPDAPITALDKTLMNNAINSTGQRNFVSRASQPNLYFYFVNYAWHYLNARGKAGFILMAKFLNNEEGKYLKKFLLNKVEAIILYPRNYFADFKVTTVITVLSKRPNKAIKFLRILDADLLSKPEAIKSILASTSSTTVTADYSIRITDRNISADENWKTYLNDPEGNFKKLDSLSFLTPLNTFFGTEKRGGAENSGGSTIIYPNFNQVPYLNIHAAHRGYGIKNNRKVRNLILSAHHLEEESAIHFPTPYDDDADNGLATLLLPDPALDSIFSTQDDADPAKWRRIVNAAHNSTVSFDILIPRADRTKHVIYYNPHPHAVVVSTNFFYLTGFRNGHPDAGITKESQLKFLTAYLNSCFGQIQFEIHSNNQEGLRKIEKFHLEQIKVPDIRQLTKAEIAAVVSEFDHLSRLNTTISGAEGLSSPRRGLDEEIAKIIFAKDALGFSDSTRLTDFFELFLADLVEDRRL